MTYQIQLRVDTAANYAAVNETYAMGEVCYISDLETIKIGNGVDAWNDLAFPAGFTGTDSAAVHLTVGGEIAGITEKVTPADADKILIEDSADDDAKKYIQIGSLPGGAGTYTDEQAQDAVGTILADSSTIDFTYSDGTPSITATVIQSAINTSNITNGAGFITSAGVTKAQVGLTNVTDNAQVKKIASSTDNTIIRWDGTSGDTPQDSLATIDDSGSVNIPSGQTYKINNVALAKGDVGLGNVQNVNWGNLSSVSENSISITNNELGKVIWTTSTSAVSAALASDLSIGFNCSVIQGAAGQVTFSGLGDITIENRQSHTKTAGVRAVASLIITPDGKCTLVGDTAA